MEEMLFNNVEGWQWEFEDKDECDLLAEAPLDLELNDQDFMDAVSFQK